MEAQLLRSRQSLRVKLPDIKKTLEMVAMLKSKHQEQEKAVETNFLVSDNIWAKAKVPNETGKVGLWLGANVMVEYTYDDALKLLTKKNEYLYHYIIIFLTRIHSCITKPN